MQATWARYLETLERLSPKIIGENEDELLQEAGRESDGQDV